MMVIWFCFLVLSFLFERQLDISISMRKFFNTLLKDAEAMCLMLNYSMSVLLWLPGGELL